MTRFSSRLVNLLLVGLLIALVISALTKRDTPVLVWFVVIGVGLILGIGRDWIKVNKSVRAKGSRLSRLVVLLTGSLPYLAAVALLVLFVYYDVKLLLGQPIDSSQSNTLGRIVIFSFVGIFIGGFLIALLTFASRGTGQRNSKKVNPPKKP